MPLYEIITCPGTLSIQTDNLAKARSRTTVDGVGDVSIIGGFNLPGNKKATVSPFEDSFRFAD